jgi:hypothetical protein
MRTGFAGRTAAVAPSLIAASPAIMYPALSFADWNQVTTPVSSTHCGGSSSCALDCVYGPPNRQRQGAGISVMWALSRTLLSTTQVADARGWHLSRYSRWPST